MPQPQRTRAQVTHLEAITVLYLRGPLPLSPPQQHVYDAENSPSPRCRSQNHNDDHMIAGKAPPPSKFNAKRESLERLHLRLTAFFTITHIRNERQKLAFVGLCLQGKALDWCKPKEDNYASWSEVHTWIQLNYGDHYRADRAQVELHKLRHCGSVPDCLNEIDRLNTYAKITDVEIINIIMNNLSGPIRCSIANCEHLRSYPTEWRAQLLCMDIISTEFQCRNINNRKPSTN